MLGRVAVLLVGLRVIIIYLHSALLKRCAAMPLSKASRATLAKCAAAAVALMATAAQLLTTTASLNPNINDYGFGLRRLGFRV